MLRRCGGRRFTASTINLLQGTDKNNILALCPCSLTKQRVAKLQSWADFVMGESVHMYACLNTLHMFVFVMLHAQNHSCGHELYLCSLTQIGSCIASVLG